MVLTSQIMFVCLFVCRSRWDDTVTNFLYHIFVAFLSFFFMNDFFFTFLDVFAHCKVHFLGWAEKWDEVLHRNSEQLQKRYTFTTPWRQVNTEREGGWGSESST